MKLRCNKCNAAFLSADVNAPHFGGESAVRVTVFLTCPYCQQTDHHWQVGHDYFPPDIARQPRYKQQRWLQEH